MEFGTFGTEKKKKYWLVRNRNYRINDGRELNTATFILVELLLCYLL